LLTEFIHDNGPHAGKQLVEIPCDRVDEKSLRDDLIAEGGRWCSLLRQAEGGTLVLNQILRLPLSIQKDLAGEFSKIASKMQVVALSDGSLEEALEQGLIDDEFYFKVTMDQIQLTPTERA